MRRISDFYTFPEGHGNDLCHSEPVNIGGVLKDGVNVATSKGNEVHSYVELLKKVAELNYSNPEYQLFSRGQHTDYRLGPGRSSNQYPTIYRPTETGHAPTLVRQRLEILEDASKKVLEYFEGMETSNEIASTELDNAVEKKRVDMRRKVVKNPLLRWAIIQHYEICETPLFDVSESLEVSLAFAFSPDRKGEYKEDAYIYIIALPHQNDTISVSSREDMISVRLSQYFPPSFLRPHFQKGLLVGEYPEVKDYEPVKTGEHRGAYNFNNRLVAKFHIVNREEFIKSEGYSMMPNSILKPTNGDEFVEVAERIKSTLAVADGINPVHT